MSAQLSQIRKPSADRAEAKVALLGLGTVGKALVERVQGWDRLAFNHALRFVHVANSRHAVSLGHLTPIADAANAVLGTCADDELSRWRQAQNGLQIEPADLDHVEGRLGTDGIRIVIDATASPLVTARQAEWLRKGIHVVTACKLGQGTDLAQFNALSEARHLTDAQYGDSATVGAGLPVIRSIRELRAGGDSITRISGILSGSLAWLFNNYDGMLPFSHWVRKAGEQGYTEPDPRDDLSGEDVRRKILILARCAGIELHSDGVDVLSLVPPELRDCSAENALANLELLDVPLKEAYTAAYKRGEVLRYVATLEQVNGGWQTSVGLQSLPKSHPLAAGAGTDNRVAIWSDRYCDQPLVIQGPGAGAQVTAAGLLDDVLRIANLSQ